MKLALSKKKKKYNFEFRVDQKQNLTNPNLFAEH